MSKSFLQNYFGFNKQQRNGLYVLTALSFTLFVLRIVYPYFITPDDITILELPLAEQKLDSAFPNKKFQKPSQKEFNRAREQKLFKFDPNTVSFEQLLLLGIKEKTAKIFLKFRDRGFVFKKKDDLKKVYGISEYQYKQLAPYVFIPQIQNTPKNTGIKEQVVFSVPEKSRENQSFAKIELNAADSAALVTIPGVGPVYAKRIIKYRNLLGGFFSMEQLREVYGITEDTYEKMQKYLSLNNTTVKKINLNTDDFKVMSRHPYLGYEFAKKICNQRREIPITPATVGDILNNNTQYQKLSPYLVFE